MTAPGRIRRKYTRNNLCKLYRARDGPPGPRLVYGPRYGASPAFLSVSPEDPDELFAREVIYQVCGCLRTSCIHAHIKRTVQHETEAPLRRLKMKPRNTEIEQHSV